VWASEEFLAVGVLGPLLPLPLRDGILTFFKKRVAFQPLLELVLGGVAGGFIATELGVGVVGD
jgi:hypothetical protein